MDVADANIGQLRVKDEVGIRCQKLFQDFLEEYVLTENYKNCEQKPNEINKFCIYHTDSKKMVK